MINGEQIKKKHSFMLDNREHMTLTGVNEVTGFSDTTVMMKTERGALSVQGSGLNISKLNTDTGELNISGEISLIKYSKDKKKGGFFEGMFK